MQRQAALLGQFNYAHQRRCGLGDQHKRPLVTIVQRYWSILWGWQRQIDMEGAAATRLALHHHPAAVERHQSPSDAEPQADPLVPPQAGVHADEGLEDLLL